jgi:hypothetical protein
MAIDTSAPSESDVASLARRGTKKLQSEIDEIDRANAEDPRAGRLRESIEERQARAAATEDPATHARLEAEINVERRELMLIERRRARLIQETESKRAKLVAAKRIAEQQEVLAPLERTIYEAVQDAVSAAVDLGNKNLRVVRLHSEWMDALGRFSVTSFGSLGNGSWLPDLGSDVTRLVAYRDALKFFGIEELSQEVDGTWSVKVNR